jgi:hypothetical protein
MGLIRKIAIGVLRGGDNGGEEIHQGVGKEPMPSTSQSRTNMWCPYCKANTVCKAVAADENGPRGAFDFVISLPRALATPLPPLLTPAFSKEYGTSWQRRYNK